MTNNKGDIGHYKYQGPHSTLKAGSKVKSDLTKRFGAHDFLEVIFTFKTSMTNNRRDIVHHTYQVPHSTLKGPHSTLKEGSKVKSDPTKRFGEHDFL